MRALFFCALISRSLSALKGILASQSLFFSFCFYVVKINLGSRLKLHDELQRGSRRPSSSCVITVCSHEAAVPWQWDEWDGVYRFALKKSEVVGTRPVWEIRSDRFGRYKVVSKLATLSCFPDPIAQLRNCIIYISRHRISSKDLLGNNMQLNISGKLLSPVFLRFCTHTNSDVTQPRPLSSPHTHTQEDTLWAKEVWKPTVLDHGTVCAPTAQRMSPRLQVSSCDDVKSSLVSHWAAGPKTKLCWGVVGICVCVCLLQCVRWWSVFPMTARGMSHLLNVAFTPPPVVCVCVYTSTPYKAWSSHSCSHKCTFQCSSCHTSCTIS